MNTPRVDILSAGAAQALAGRVARECGVELAGQFGAVGAMREAFLTGAPCDLVVLTHAQIAELTAQGHIAPSCSGELGTVRTAIAVRAGTVPPDVSDAAALRRALLAADAIYYPDPQRATAGIHFAKVIEALGIRAEVEKRLQPRPNGMTAMRDLAGAGGQSIGCTQATEIRATAGVVLAGSLPPGHELATVYTAAVAARAAHAAAAADFAERLWRDAARAQRQAAGYEGCTIRPALPADAAAVAAMVHEVRREFGLSQSSANDADLQDLQTSYMGRRGHLDVVVDGTGRLVGCCGLVPMAEAAGTPQGELRKLFLLASARGQGIGRRLLDRAVAFARGQGWQRMRLETAASLQRAMNLYQAAGFVLTARHDAATACDRVFELDLR